VRGWDRKQPMCLVEDMMYKRDGWRLGDGRPLNPTFLPEGEKEPGIGSLRR